MNIWKRIYCRVFQKIMHLLIPFFPYREPKLLKCIEDIIEIFKDKNIQSVLLVTDKGIRGLGLTKKLENLLEENNILCTVYDQTLPNPTSNNVLEAKGLYLSNFSNSIG